MTLSLLTLSLAVISLALPDKAAPQAPASHSPPTIVVTAPPRKRVPQIVEHFGEVFSGDRLSRWSAPLCPYVTGVTPDQATFTRQRIIQIAQAARIPIAAEQGCDKNFVVIFSADALALRIALGKRGNRLLSTGSRWPIDKLQLNAFVKDDGAPAHVFYLNGEGGAFGGASMEAGAIAGLANVALTGSIFGPRVSQGFGTSRLVPHVDDTIDRVIIVIDGDHLTGFKIQQIAAFIAMIGLAEIRLDRPNTDVNSITRMFADAEEGKTTTGGFNLLG